MSHLCSATVASAVNCAVAGGRRNCDGSFVVGTCHRQGRGRATSCDRMTRSIGHAEARCVHCAKKQYVEATGGCRVATKCKTADKLVMLGRTAALFGSMAFSTLAGLNCTLSDCEETCRLFGIRIVPGRGRKNQTQSARAGASTIIPEARP